MRIQFLLAAFLCFVYTFSSAQLNNPQIRLRLGISRPVLSYGTSDKQPVYKIYDPGSLTASFLGLEYSKALKTNNGTNLLLGIFLENQSYAVRINPDRFSQQPSSLYSVIQSSQESVRLYVGLEKGINKKEQEKGKGYFSLFGGLGISYNGRTESSGLTATEIGDGTTTDGKHFEGEYINHPVISFNGYFMATHERAAHPLTPDVFAGIRYNLLNQKGNMAIGAEVLINYALVTKFYVDMPYTLDGQPESDRFKNKGSNVQFNLIIPLKNFGKRKKNKI